MNALLKRFKNDQSGATAIEYGLIAALIALAIMVGANQLGGAINTKFSEIATTLDGAGDPPAPTTP
jgi:pilus assembly protein Flp/PilA